MEMTIEDLKQLRESEDHIEFKEAKHNYPFTGGKHTDPKRQGGGVSWGILSLWRMKEADGWCWVWQTIYPMQWSALILRKMKSGNSWMKSTNGWA